MSDNIPPSDSVAIEIVEEFDIWDDLATFQLQLLALLHRLQTKK
mgnify:CR=1 FL=1